MALYYGADPSRFGTSTAVSTTLPAGGTNELFLKVFAGEVMTTFEEANVMMPLHTVRTIASGKSASFPTTGVASATYHTPGDSVLVDGVDAGSDSFADSSKYLSKPNHAEKIIYIDDLLVSASFVANIDEAKNHYDVRSIYSTEMGRQLAYSADKALIRCVINGAKNGTDRFGGTSSTYLGLDTDIAAGGSVTGAEWIDAMFLAAQTFDEKNVPPTGRYAVLPPAEYYKMVESDTTAINRDYNDPGNGSVAAGVVHSVAGIRLLKSNHIPTANENATQDSVLGHAGVLNDTAGTGTGYSGTNYTNQVGLAFQSEGLGTVKLMDLAVETDYSVERQGTLLVAKYAMGHAPLRQECLISFKTA